MPPWMKDGEPEAAREGDAMLREHPRLDPEACSGPPQSAKLFQSASAVRDVCVSGAYTSASGANAAAAGTAGQQPLGPGLIQST